MRLQEAWIRKISVNIPASYLRKSGNGVECGEKKREEEL